MSEARRQLREAAREHGRAQIQKAIRVVKMPAVRIALPRVLHATRNPGSVRPERVRHLIILRPVAGVARVWADLRGAEGAQPRFRADRLEPVEDSVFDRI